MSAASNDVLARWHAAAAAWRKALPQVVQRLDGSRYFAGKTLKTDADWIAAGFSSDGRGGWHRGPNELVPLEAALADATDELARLAKKQAVNAGPAIAFAIALRKSLGMLDKDARILGLADAMKELLYELSLVVPRAAAGKPTKASTKKDAQKAKVRELARAPGWAAMGTKQQLKLLAEAGVPIVERTLRNYMNEIGRGDD